jgi:hypothetical protein
METNKYLTVDGRWEVTDKNASVMSGEAANREIDYLRRVYSISAKMEVTHKPRY